MEASANAETKKPLTGEPRPLLPGNQRKNLGAGGITGETGFVIKKRPASPSSGGAIKTDEGEAMFALGGDYFTGEPRPLLPGNQRKNLGAGGLTGEAGFVLKKCPASPSSGGEINTDEGEAMFAVGGDYLTGEPRSLPVPGEYKNLRAHKAAPLFPDGEDKKSNEAVLGGGDQKRRKTLFLSGEGVDTGLPGGEGVDFRAHEPVHISDDKSSKRQDEAAPMYPGKEETSAPPPVTERTPAAPPLIAEAIQANGPPPRRLILLGPESDEEDEHQDPVALALRWRGVEREDRYDPYVDYFLIGRPEPESWYQIWRERPLHLHDAGLVAAVDSVMVLGAGKRTNHLDVSDRITRVLQIHPGPVATLRMDPSEFPGEDCLTRWMSLLSMKHANKVVLINVTRPVEATEPPLDQLRSVGLTYLGLGFVNLRKCMRKSFASACEHGHAWSALRHLSLTGCIFFGTHLASTLRDIWGLMSLRIAHCELTQGCREEEGLEIESPSLVSVVITSCTATTKVVLGRAPNIVNLHLGVRPITSSGTLPIHIKFCEKLGELSGLSLPCHDITLWSSYTVKVNRKSMLSFRSLRTVVTMVDMRTGSEALYDFLNMVPHLGRLVVSFIHSSGDGPYFPSLDKVPGIANSLQHLVVSGFNGCRAEVTFVLEILATAQRLLSLSVTVHPDASMPMSLREAAEFLKESPTTSKHCRIRVGR